MSAPTPTPRMLDPRFRGAAPALPAPAPSAQPAQSGQVGLPQRWEHLLRRSGLTAEARRVGMVLTGYANVAGALGADTPGLRRLTAGVQMHSLTVRAGLRELEEHGWIRRDPNPIGPQGSEVRAITLTIPAHLQEPTS